MKPPVYTEIAVHPHWISPLKFIPHTGCVCHQRNGSEGTYEILGARLSINWEGLGAETFWKVGQRFVQESLFATPRSQIWSMEEDSFVFVFFEIL